MSAPEVEASSDGKALEMLPEVPFSFKQVDVARAGRGGPEWPPVCMMDTYDIIHSYLVKG